MPNIYDNSKMCFGNVKIKKHIYLEDVIESLEYSFFCSKFNEWINNANDKEIKLFHSNNYCKHFFNNKYKIKTLRGLL